MPTTGGHFQIAGPNSARVARPVNRALSVSEVCEFLESAPLNFMAKEEL
jgi:hypothetical protein